MPHICPSQYPSGSAQLGGKGTSGRGGGVPGYSSRQTAAAKQKAANATSTEPVSTTTHSGSTPPNVFFAPTPVANDISPVRTQAA